jgi:hypothetical protein
MLADYSVELGRDDPALELPWASDKRVADERASDERASDEQGPDGPEQRYYDLKKHPELLLEIPEASAHPELGAFLARINAPKFPLATAKCDAWATREILPEEEIFGAEFKFASYVDLVFADEAARLSFEKHEALAQGLCRLLRHAPEIAASVEFVVRRCYYHRREAPAVGVDDSESGFYCTAYVSAFGDGAEEARKQWTIALALVQNALVQVAGHWSAADFR